MGTVLYVCDVELRKCAVAPAPLRTIGTGSVNRRGPWRAFRCAPAGRRAGQAPGRVPEAVPTTLAGLSRDATDRDQRFEVERYLTGIARQALGREELKRYPSPLGKADLPAQVQPVAERWLALVVNKALTGDKPAKRIVRESRISTGERVRLYNKLRQEHQRLRGGLSAESAKARAWGFAGERNERKAVTGGTRPKRLVSVEE